uniref:Uncharacterized protein n=1 Tax=Vibrio cholerae TaxID=666 RepID=O85211_VIBCL|nr:unknown [Vibrio cholerae]
MKVVYMGISHRKGISNKGLGKPYEMHKIHFATPIETIDTPTCPYQDVACKSKHWISTALFTSVRQSKPVIGSECLCGAETFQLYPNMGSRSDSVTVSGGLLPKASCSRMQLPIPACNTKQPPM